MGREFNEHSELVEFSLEDIRGMIDDFEAVTEKCDSREWAPEDARLLQGACVFLATIMDGRGPEQREVEKAWWLAALSYQVGYRAGRRSWMLENMRVADEHRVDD